MYKIFKNIFSQFIKSDTKKPLKYKENNTEIQRFEKYLNQKLKKLDLEEVNCFNGDLLSQLIMKPSKSDDTIFDKKIDSIVYIKKKNNIDINIKEISAISTSKSKSWGYSFKDIYNFGKSIYLGEWHKNDELRDRNWDFNNSISHVKKETYGKSFDLTYYSWNKRILWNNSGSSHHFATAVFHSFNQNIEYKINADITTYYINIEHTLKLLEEYELFVFKKENLSDIKSFENSNAVKYWNTNSSYNIVMGLRKDDSTLHDYINLFRKMDDNYILSLNYLLMRKIDIQNSQKKKE